MFPIKKFIVGIKPSQKIFRISSVNGMLMDEILALRGSKLISDEYYTEVSRSSDSSSFGLKNSKEGNELKVEPENIIFIKNMYESEKKLDLQQCLQEFRVIWKTLNERLQLKGIRRLGLVLEHQVTLADKADDANESLLRKLTSVEPKNHIAKFQLHYEERRHENKVIDLAKDNFINVIFDFYDSSIDADHPSEGCVNFNIDYQKYYSPLFTGNVFDELFVLTRPLEEERLKFEKELKNRGLL